MARRKKGQNEPNAVKGKARKKQKRSKATTKAAKMEANNAKAARNMKDDPCVPIKLNVDRIKRGGRDLTAVVMKVLAARDFRQRRTLQRYKDAIAHCIGADRVKPSALNVRPIVERKLETMVLEDSTEIDKRITQAAILFRIHWQTLNAILLEIDQKLATIRNAPPVLDDYSTAKKEADEESNKENAEEGTKRANADSSGEEMKPVLSIASPLVQKKASNTRRRSNAILLNDSEEDGSAATTPDVVVVEEEVVTERERDPFEGRTFDTTAVFDGDAVDTTKSKEERFRSFVQQILYHLEGDERKYIEWIVQLMLDPSYYAKLPSVYHRAKVLQYFKLLLPSLACSDFYPEAVRFSQFVTDRRTITIKRRVNGNESNNVEEIEDDDEEDKIELEGVYEKLLIEQIMREREEEEKKEREKKEKEEEKKKGKESEAVRKEIVDVEKNEEEGWDWLEEDEMRRREAGMLDDDEEDMEDDGREDNGNEFLEYLADANEDEMDDQEQLLEEQNERGMEDGNELIVINEEVIQEIDNNSNDSFGTHIIDIEGEGEDEEDMEDEEEEEDDIEQMVKHYEDEEDEDEEEGSVDRKKGFILSTAREEENEDEDESDSPHLPSVDDEGDDVMEEAQEEKKKGRKTRKNGKDMEEEKTRKGRKRGRKNDELPEVAAFYLPEKTEDSSMSPQVGSPRVQKDKKETSNRRSPRIQRMETQAKRAKVASEKEET